MSHHFYTVSKTYNILTALIKDLRSLRIGQKKTTLGYVTCVKDERSSTHWFVYPMRDVISQLSDQNFMSKMLPYFPI